MKVLKQKISSVIFGVQSGTSAAFLAVLVLCFSVQGVSEEIEGAEFDVSETYTQKLLDFAKESEKQGNEGPGQVMRMTTVINDEIALKEHLGEDLVNLAVEEPAEQLMDLMVRRSGRYSVVTGEIGSGRMAVVETLARKIESNDLPDGIHTQELGDKVLFRVSARNFDKDKGSMFLQSYLDTVSFMAQNTGISPVIVITEAQFLYNISLSALTEAAPSIQNGLPVIIVSDDKSYTTKITDDPEFQKYLSVIRTKSLAGEELIKVIEESGYLELMKRRYNIRFRDSAIEALVDVAPDYRIDLAEPERSQQLIEAIAVKSSRLRASNNQKITKKDVFKFVAEATGVPVVPQDRQAFADYMKSVEERVLSRVKHQDHIAKGLVKQFRRALTSRGKKKHSAAMIMGGTGIGKTYTAEVLAKEFYGSTDRILEIDMAGLQDPSKESVLFGAANGLVSSDTNKGTICEFLEGAGKGGGIIIMNEFEEAHPKIITRMMEMFDNGYVRCGDGKVRYLGRSLIVATSNKASGRLLPAKRVRGGSQADAQKMASEIPKEKMQEAWTEKDSYLEDDDQIKNAVVQRFDEWYMGTPILAEGAVEITDLEIQKFAKEQAKADDVSLEVDSSFTETITSAFYNEENGARQLKIMVKKLLDEAISDFREKYGQDSQDFEVSAELHPTKKNESYITITEVGTDKSLTIAGPKIPLKNQLLDPNFRNRLRDLEKNLKSEVFGQDESIRAIVGSANSRFINPEANEAMGGFLLGTTGTGKTQLAKSTAKFLFGREDAVNIVSMGNVKDKAALQNIFSPPKGYVGSGEPGKLERFLREFPDGGVIVFDEASNMGGNNMAAKEELFYEFYELLEEGKYVNPSGKEYDLTKYLFIFTGNDGQELFKGLRSDSLIEETYREMIKSPGKIEEILIKAGVPPAFIGRLDFVSLMRPALMSHREMIADKLISIWKSEVNSAQPFDVEFSDDFVMEMAVLLFDPERGARSVKRFLKTFVGKAVGDMMHDLDWDAMIEKGEKGVIRIGLDVDASADPFYSDNRPYKNKADLLISSEMNGETIRSQKISFTNAATFGAQAHIDDARYVAIHEMGHLLVSFTDITGKLPVKINIIPERIGDMSTLGYAQYRDIEVPGSRTRDWLVKHVAGLMAGSEAEKVMLESPTNNGRSNDLEKVGKMIRRQLLEGHIMTEFDAAHAFQEPDGTFKLPKKLEDELLTQVNLIIEEARKLAQLTVREQAHILVAGVDLLMKEGDINEKTIKNLLNRGQEAREKASAEVQAKVTEGELKAQDVYEIDMDGVLDTRNAYADASEAESCEELFQ